MKHPNIKLKTRYYDTIKKDFNHENPRGEDYRTSLHTPHDLQKHSKIRNALAIMHGADNEIRSILHDYILTNQDRLKQYVKVVLGKGNVDRDDLSTRTKNQMLKIIELFDEGKGNSNPAIAGSYWAAYNGVTEWLSYERGNNNDNRMSSLWFGQNANVNRTAFDSATVKHFKITCQPAFIMNLNIATFFRFFTMTGTFNI